MTRQARGEMLTGVGWLLGWSAMTAWLAMLFGWGAILCSAGVLLLGVSGLRPLGLLLWHGLNFLPKSED